MEQFDVVVVGGGIAGSSIAAALAPAGVSVLVLERQTTYRDKVRGEYMQPWGVAEMLRLGLEQTLLEAGGGYTNAFVTYGEHIDPVTAEENVRRGEGPTAVNARKARCHRGHPLDYVDSQGARQCSTCRTVRSAA